MIGAVVLAAGTSTRMGTQKLLLPWAGNPLIRHIVEAVLKGPVSETVVVTGHSRAEVERALAGLDIHFAHNLEYEQGMLSSVRAGVRNLSEELAPMIVLGDQPAVPKEVMTALAERIETNPDAIVVPTINGRRGHPIVFGAAYRNEVLTRFDSVGLRGLLRAHPERIVEIESNTPAILTDLDTPQDYRAALKMLQPDTDDDGHGSRTETHRD